MVLALSLDVRRGAGDPQKDKGPNQSRAAVSLWHAGPERHGRYCEGPSPPCLWGEGEEGTRALGFAEPEAAGLMSRTGQWGGAAGLGEFAMALALGKLSSETMAPLCLALLSGCPRRGLRGSPPCGRAQELAAAVRTQGLLC